MVLKMWIAQKIYTQSVGKKQVRHALRNLKKIAVNLLVLFGIMFSPGEVGAKTGLYATPSAAIVGLYDDNLFFSTLQKKADHIFRISPAIEAGYFSDLMTLDSRYTFDAERYTRYSELDSKQARKQAALDFNYRHNRLLTFATDADYIKTQTPSDLSPKTGLLFGRARAESFTFNQSLAYQPDYINTGTMTYRFSRNKLAGGSNDIHTVELDQKRQISPRDTVNIAFHFDKFIFDDTEDTVNSYVLLGGGKRQFSQRTAITVLGGPRFSDDSIDPEVSATLIYKLDRGEFSFDYSRNETTVLGLTGTATTEGISARLIHSFGSALEIQATPRYTSTKHNDLKVNVLSLNIESGYRITRYFTFIGSYGFSSQRGVLNISSDNKISRNTLLVGLAIAIPRDSDRTERPRRVLPPSMLDDDTTNSKSKQPTVTDIDSKEEEEQ